MRRHVLTALTLIGCDGPAALPDGNTAHDASIGAPVVGCPPIGTAPRFKPELHVIAINCSRYSEGAGIAFVNCGDGPHNGALNGPFLLSQGLTPTAGNESVIVGGVYPEGDRVLAAQASNDGLVSPTASIYRRTGDAWSWETDTGIVLGNGASPGGTDRVGNVSAGSPRRLVVLHETGSPPVGWEIREYVGDDSSWTLRDAYDLPTQLNVRLAGTPSISPDGLRMVFWAIREFHWAIFYVDRANIDARFGMAVPLDDVAPLSSSVEGTVLRPFLAADCSRIYVEGLGAVMYQEQQ